MAHLSTNRTVHVVIPGWGPSHLDEKRRILKHNLELLDSTRGTWQLKVTIFCYGDEPVLVDRCVPKHIACQVIYTEGIVGDFIYRFVKPDTFFDASTQYVLLHMDDAELDMDTYHLARAIEVLKASSLDILSPAMTPASKLTSDSKRYWKNRVLPAAVERARVRQEERKRDDEAADNKPIEVVRHMHQMEYYSYLMSINTYEIYYSLFSADTHWMFGIDLILHDEGLRPGIWDNAMFTHHFAGDSYALNKQHDPWAEMQKLGVVRRGNKPFDWHTTVLDIKELQLVENDEVYWSVDVSSFWNTGSVLRPDELRTAICWLTVRLSPEHQQILPAVKNQFPGLDVFYVTDAEQSFWMAPDPRLPYPVTKLAVSDEDSFNAGFCKTIGAMQKPITSAWDKMFFFFCSFLTAYDRLVWLEDDVLLPSLDTLGPFLQEYTQPATDLVLAEDEENSTGNLDGWWWFRMKGSDIPAPFYRSMVCAGMMSRRLLNAIDQRRVKHHELFFNEIMLNTLAHKANLNVVTAPELSSIVWKHDWTERDFSQQPERFYHPVKNMPIHRRTLQTVPPKQINQLALPQPLSLQVKEMALASSLDYYPSNEYAQSIVLPDAY